MAEKVYKIDIPKGMSVCVIADSPHSGAKYPDDFGYDCSLHELRKAEDMAVDTLYDFLPDIGISFLQAQYPRSYVDPNRADGASQKFIKEGEQDYKGKESGLVREKCTPRSKEKVYDRPLKLSAVFNRVATYYKPYHDKLAEMLDETHARHGKVVHLDCHSMPSTLKRGTVKNPYDVIIGTRHGRTCSPELAEHLRDLLEAKGYKVGININGFFGAEIVRRSGNPAKGRHSIQIELNRSLYMDEETLALKPEREKLKQDLKGIVSEFAVWCEALPLSVSPPVQPPHKSNGRARPAL